MSNEKFVFVKICFYFEGKSIVKPITILSRQFPSFIADLCASSSPSFLIILDIFVLNHRVNSRFHPIIEKRISFCEIDNCKSVLFMWFHSLNRKIEPLIAAIRIGVIGHRKIILILTDFKGSKKIPTLELTIKSEIIGLERRYFRFRHIIILVENL